LPQITTEFATTKFLAERVVFPLHDNVIAAHDHIMEDGDRLLFDTKKCKIIFGVSPINGDRRFSWWYEMLGSQINGSAGNEALAEELKRRVADAKAQVELSIEQEKMQGVARLRANQQKYCLRRAWEALSTPIRERTLIQNSSRGNPNCAKKSGSEARDALREKLRQARESRRLGYHR